MLNQSEVEEILRKAEESSPVCAAAIQEMRSRQRAMQKKQNRFLKNNKSTSEESMLDQSGDAFARKVREYAKKDYSDLSNFNKNKEGIHFSIKFNKMPEIIEQTQSLFDDDETNIMKIAMGQIPSEYSNEISGFPILGQGPFWGTARVAHLNYAILSINFTLNGTTINDIPLTSAITHVSPLPGQLLDSTCRFAYTKDNKYGFGFVHSGYAFGGHRFEESFYPDGKTFGPEDCSSALSKIYGFYKPYPITTADFVASYRSQTGIYPQSIPQNWNREIKEASVEFFEPITDKNDVKPGDALVFRKFPLDQVETTLGMGGHTAIILGTGTPRDNKITAISYNRGDLPDTTDGFGVSQYAITPKTVNQITLPMFFRLRENKANKLMEAGRLPRLTI